MGDDRELETEAARELLLEVEQKRKALNGALVLAQGAMGFFALAGAVALATLVAKPFDTDVPVSFWTFFMLAAAPTIFVVNARKIESLGRSVGPGMLMVAAAVSMGAFIGAVAFDGDGSRMAQLAVQAAGFAALAVVYRALHFAGLALMYGVFGGATATDNAPVEFLLAIAAIGLIVLAVFREGRTEPRLRDA